MSSICVLHISNSNSELLCLVKTEAKKLVYKIRMHISSMSTKTWVQNCTDTYTSQSFANAIHSILVFIWTIHRYDVRYCGKSRRQSGVMWNRTHIICGIVMHSASAWAAHDIAWHSDLLLFVNSADWIPFLRMH